MSIRKGKDVIANSVLSGIELQSILTNYATTAALTNEITRAQATESIFSTNLTNEIARATAAEDAKLSSSDTTVTKQGNTFNGASQLVQLNSSGKLPPLNGSLLTGLPLLGADTSLSNITTTQNTISTNLNNVGVRTVKVSYVNGTSWYRIWSDGWVEQGGNTGLTSGDITITFLKPFTNTNYSVLVSSTSGVTNVGADTKTISSFIIGIPGTNSAQWFACGY